MTMDITLVLAPRVVSGFLGRLEEGAASAKKAGRAGLAAANKLRNEARAVAGVGKSSGSAPLARAKNAPVVDTWEAESVDPTRPVMCVVAATRRGARAQSGAARLARQRPFSPCQPLTAANLYLPPSPPSPLHPPYRVVLLFSSSSSIFAGTTTRRSLRVSWPTSRRPRRRRPSRRAARVSSSARPRLPGRSTRASRARAPASRAPRRAPPPPPRQTASTTAATAATAATTRSPSSSTAAALCPP